MTDRHLTMMEPPLEDLLGRVDSKFTLVSLAALRGRQINSYFNQLGEGLGTIVPPQVTSVSRKPLSIALEEVAAGKIIYYRPGVDPAAEASGAEVATIDARDHADTPDVDIPGSGPTGSVAAGEPAVAEVETGGVETGGDGSALAEEVPEAPEPEQGPGSEGEQ